MLFYPHEKRVEEAVGYTARATAFAPTKLLEEVVAEV